MSSINIIEIWNNLNQIEKNINYNVLRLSIDCKPNLYLGISPSGNKCLILNLANGFNLKVNGFLKGNLKLEYHKGLGYLILELLNEFYIDVFNDLIISIYSDIKFIEKDFEASTQFLKTLYNWSEFFLPTDNIKMSENEVMGLWGELYILLQVLKNGKKTTINEYIKSWMGPYNKSHDFELEDKSLEIKTKMSYAHSVHISSINQLEKLGEKKLHLLVLSVNSNENGVSLKKLSLQIRDEINNCHGSVSFFYKALMALGLDLTGMDEYDNYKYDYVGMDIYDCLLKDFPRLTKDTYLPSAVIEVKYKLELKRMKDFLIQEEVYEY